MNRLNSVFYKLNVDDSNVDDSLDINDLFEEMNFEGVDPNQLNWIDDNDDHGFFLTNLDIISINKVKNIFENNLINVTYVDITEDIFLGKYAGCNLSILDEFRLQYITKDDILDKINESGMDSLDKIDYAILDYNK